MDGVSCSPESSVTLLELWILDNVTSKGVSIITYSACILNYHFILCYLNILIRIKTYSSFP